MSLLWRLYGNEYDLAVFMDHHPGGRLILEQARGISDATALFESYHHPAMIESARVRLQTFMIRENAYECPYTFEDEGFYSVLRKRVYATITGKKKAVYSPLYWLKMIASITAFGAGLVVCRHDATWSFLLGVLYLSIGFNVMHDASHYAVCASPRINQFLSMVWQAPIGWDAVLWHSHHVVHHHSFTGTGADPDIVHMEPVLYKIPNSMDRPIAVWDVYARIVFLVLFAMYFGQMVVYNRWNTRVAFTFLPYPYRDDSEWIRKSCSVAVLCGIVACTPLSSIVSFVVGANVAYAINIFCDHDTFETHTNAVKYKDRRNWGERQVLESANWGGSVWCHIFGGINYQIEHHLFPSIYHGHYPAIAPIVRRACKEHGIPYVRFPTIIHALADFLKKMIHVNT